MTLAPIDLSRTDEAIDEVHFGPRQGAHIFEHAVDEALCWLCRSLGVEDSANDLKKEWLASKDGQEASAKLRSFAAFALLKSLPKVVKQ